MWPRLSSYTWFAKCMRDQGRCSMMITAISLASSIRRLVISSITPIPTPSVGSSSSSSFGFPNSAHRSPGPYARRPKASHPADRSGVRPVEEACKLLGPSARLRVTGLRSYRLPAAGALGTAYMSRRCRLLLLSGSLQGQLRNIDVPQRPCSPPAQHARAGISENEQRLSCSR